MTMFITMGLWVYHGFSGSGCLILWMVDNTKISNSSFEKKQVVNLKMDEKCVICINFIKTMISYLDPEIHLQV